MFRSNSTWKLKKINVASLIENHKELIKNNKLILKSEKRFWSEKHNTFTEELKKIV